jgi:hypothetical protein
VLARHPWTFASRRVTARVIDDAVSTWAYAYAVPADLLLVNLVLDPAAADDLQVRTSKVVDPRLRVHSPAQEPTTQPYTVETTQEGHRVLRTDQVDAVLVYTARNVDFRVWDVLAREACVFWLAHLVAGDTAKSKTGIALAQGFLQMAMVKIAEAKATNAEYQRDVRPQPGCPWLP